MEPHQALCPCCGAPMEKGTLEASGNIRWMPQGAKNPALYAREKYAARGAILFPPYWDDKDLLESTKTQAWICRVCQKMTVDFPVEA